MIIFGVDPGTVLTGFGIINFHKNELIKIDAGVIKPSAKLELAKKLEVIYDDLSRLIKKHNPDEFAIETAFYGKNVQSAMKIGYARGVSLLASVHNNVPASEYSPREVKKSVVGNGAASKEQVQYMIRKLLAINKSNMKFDESDALAVAVCHAFKMKTISTKSGSWKSFIEANPDRVVGD
ncbi:MAG: crossover junction endodeoxyribonuclease RuvC [Melioribacteraceae bacterium]|nr:crossover junction endodeoxyribonuclease RuvC [Melioribacteraceae bacterium]MCF8356771.1 crossover junction endodeoxyribonuclease RuvC [Melioribacteraceae bacterium]MCF8396133.1 crossover junction endodeoxyribonuclease RuvC [Melioribacteraceae bacterium]MCF8421101.1 crossover junction endodeoxyribonuclease RuvC [Melioribacteraceae bacterium]